MRLLEQILREPLTREPASLSEAGLLVASTKSGRILSIRVFHRDIPYPRRCFRISLVNTPYPGERQVTALRFMGEDTQTCGYVFPLMSLRTGEYLPEGKWPSVYAAAATRELLESNIAVRFMAKKVLEKDELDITDLFPDNLGVLVLGQKQLDNAVTSIEAIELMLMEYGYVPRSVSIISNNIMNCALTYESRVSLRHLATHLEDDILSLKWLMASTSVQQTEMGRFLALYQIIECLLSRVFGKAMNHMISDPRSKTDPWWVRGTVQNIQKERWRLNFIENYCLHKGMSRTSFSDNQLACENLLINLKRREADDKKLSWAKTLYRIRNLFVHNQAALREADESLMESVCDTLQYVCFDLLNGYTDPSSDFLNIKIEELD